VSFRYTEATPTVLPELNLTIPAGQTVALVGPTGAGKSTIAKLVARFYDPTTGAVTLDGVDLARIADADLRREVVMVTQESFLFAGSVADNIGLGRPDAGRAEIRQAAEAVGAHEFITGLPDGYDTVVGERGHRLSGGEKQRVAIARVILRDPRILILDEATSSLDSVSEHHIQAALRPLLRGRTAIVIAHRLSTVLAADQILVLDRGRLVDSGPHAELLARGGLYATLYERQFRAQTTADDGPAAPAGVPASDRVTVGCRADPDRAAAGSSR
jgi:ABC-type multidrug transport system fused ATPase/permease subunit